METITVTRWKIDSTAFEEREKDYTATFTCHNMDTGKSVDLTLRQDKSCPVGDLIGACKALAQLFVQAATIDDDGPNTVTLN